MKTGLTLVLFISFLFGASAQNWFSENSSWLYRYSTWSSSGYEKLTITGDTTIATQSYKKMHLSNALKYYQYPNNPPIIQDKDVLVYEENDQVFYLDPSFGDVLLYDFSAEVNDEILLVNECENDYYYRILETGTEAINGTPKRYQLITVNIPEFYTNDTFKIIEGIGMTLDANVTFGAIPTSYFFIHQALLCFYDTDRWTFYCYHEDSLEYNPLSADCEALDNFILSSEELHLAERIKVYPSTFKEEIHLEKMETAPLTLITVFDLNGRLVFQAQEDLSTVNLGYLAAGVYLLKVVDQQGLQLTTKIIKQ